MAAATLYARCAWLLLLFLRESSCFVMQPAFSSTSDTKVPWVLRDASRREEEYVNPITGLAGRFLDSKGSNDELDIEWNAPKATMLPAAQLAARLEDGLRVNEWFVTGLIMPEYFADDFRFEDPDVKLNGIKQYSDGVRRLFDKSSRAQIVNCELRSEEELPPGITAILTVSWRLSGKVNIGLLQLNIKPYIVYSDLHIRQSDGLVVYQLDRFSIPSWDILLSAFLPWLPFLAPEAPPVD